MTKFAPLFLLPALALAACGEEPAAEATAAPVVEPEPIVELPAPDRELFSTLLAEACPGLEPVNTAVCRRGLGAPTASCEYGLGDDEYLRNDATIEVDETGEAWALVDAEAVCAQ